MLPEVPSEEMAAALDACAAEVLWEADIDRPPVDAFEIVERLELTVTSDDAMLHRARIVRLADQFGGSEGQATIVIGPAERPERAQWAIAHEIGESVAHRVLEALGILPEYAPDNAREWVANRLAGNLLLPGKWFATHGLANDWDLHALKRCFETASHELIGRRMLEMRPGVVITVCDLGKVTWRHSNVSYRVPPMLAEERDVWRRVHGSGRSARANFDAPEGGLDRVACWAIHEPGWKREILRSEVAEW